MTKKAIISLNAYNPLGLKLVLVFTIFSSMTIADMEADIGILASAIDNSAPPFERVLYIHYLVWFKKNQAKV